MRYKIAAVYVLLQVLFFAGWTVREESQFWGGESVVVRVVPVDPRDMLSGQYMRLGYEFSNLSDLGIDRRRGEDDRERWGDDVWVVLAEKDGLHSPVRASFERPDADSLGEGEVLLKGTYRWWARATFGVERYFVPEGTPTPDPEDLRVRLRIGDGGKARIEEVTLDGQPWP